MSILADIVASKRRELEALPDGQPTAGELRAAVHRRGGVRDFTGALRRADGRPALIAEIKKASPSAGVIRPEFDPVAIAKDYALGGADALSVLTDVPFFQGALEYLRRVREAVSLPLLRKDFIIDARQIREAVEWGADAVLLIVAILSEPDLRRLHTLATEAGLGALVEVHDEQELDCAWGIGARLIGVNNRNLKTFEVDLATTERLAARLKPAMDAGDALLVAESGIRHRADIDRLAACGARAVLVGESLMRHSDLADKVHTLLGR